MTLSLALVSSQLREERERIKAYHVIVFMCVDKFIGWIEYNVSVAAVMVTVTAFRKSTSNYFIPFSNREDTQWKQNIMFFSHFLFTFFDTHTLQTQSLAHSFSLSHTSFHSHIVFICLFVCVGRRVGAILFAVPWLNFLKKGYTSGWRKVGDYLFSLYKGIWQPFDIKRVEENTVAERVRESERAIHTRTFHFSMGVCFFPIPLPHHFFRSVLSSIESVRVHACANLTRLKSKPFKRLFIVLKIDITICNVLCWLMQRTRVFVHELGNVNLWRRINLCGAGLWVMWGYFSFQHVFRRFAHNQFEDVEQHHNKWFHCVFHTPFTRWLQESPAIVHFHSYKFNQSDLILFISYYKPMGWPAVNIKLSNIHLKSV